MFLIKLDPVTKVGIAHNMDAIQIYTFAQPYIYNSISSTCPNLYEFHFIFR
jgi:hypothetical protein